MHTRSSSRLLGVPSVHYGNTLPLLGQHGQDGTRRKHRTSPAIHPLLSQPGRDLAAREPGLVELAGNPDDLLLSYVHFQVETIGTEPPPIGDTAPKLFAVRFFAHSIGFS